MSGHNFLSQWHDAAWRLTDPGDGGVIPPSKCGIVEMTIAASTAETNTLAVPPRAGILLILHADTVGASGTRTITVASGIDADSNTSIVFNAAGDMAALLACKVGTTYQWRLLKQISSISGVGMELLEGVTAGTAAAGKVLTLDSDSAIDTVGAVSTVGKPAVSAAEHGAGAIGTGSIGAPDTYRFTRDGVIITEIQIDLTGLASKNTADDIIGLAAGGDAYIGRNVVATNGVIYKIEMICLETPAGGDNDINLVSGSASDDAYDDAVTDAAVEINGGDQVAGMVSTQAAPAVTANYYFYLTAGTGDTAAAYTAGMFIIRLHGHAALA